MAEYKKKIIIDTSQAESSLDSLSEKTEDFNKQLSDIPGPLGDISKAFKSLKVGLKGLTLGFRGLAGAIAATGIGLLVLAVASLAAYFKNTEKGAQQFRVAMSALSAVTGTLTDILVSMGETLVKLFTEPKKTLTEFGNSLKTYLIDNVNKIIDGLGLLGTAVKKLFERDFDGAMEVATEGAKKLADGMTNLNPATAVIRRLAEGASDLADEIVNDVNAAIELEDALNKVKVTERELGVERSKNNLEVEKAKNLAKDETKSLEERQAALQTVIDLETSLVEKEIANENERLRILQAQNELSSTGEDDLQAVADQESKIFELEQKSFALRTSLVSELNSFKNKVSADQIAASTAEMAAAEELAIEELELVRQLEDSKASLLAEGREKELELSRLEFERKLQDIRGNSEIENQLRMSIAEEQKVEQDEINAEFDQEEIDRLKAQAANIKEIDDKELDDKKAKAEKEKQLRLDVAAASLQSASQLTSAISGLVNQQFDNQIKAAEGNEKLQEKIRKKQFKANKALQIVNAVIGTAAAVVASAAQLGFPAAIPGIIAAAALGAVQIATIASAKYSPTGGSGGGSRPQVPAPPSVGGASQGPNVSFTGSGNNLNTVGGGVEQLPVPTINANVTISETEITGTQNTVSEYENNSLLSGG